MGFLLLSQMATIFLSIAGLVVKPHPTSPKGEECLYAHKRVNICHFPTYQQSICKFVSPPFGGVGGGFFFLHPPCLQQSLCVRRFEASEVREDLHQVASVST